MTKKILTIDFETHDPYITRGLGAGWVYKVNIEESDFEVLGAALRTHEGKIYYETNLQAIKEQVERHDILIMHNASYDLGCLHAINCDIIDKPVFDTEVMSRLFNSSLQSHSLDIISKKYLKYGKTDKVLADAVWDNELYPWLKKEINDKERSLKKGETYQRVRPDDAKLIKFAKANMKLIQQVDLNAMATYATGDVTPTFELFNYFRNNKLDMALAYKYSMLSHITIDYRLRGVRIDLNKAREVHNKLVPIIAEKYANVYEIAGEEFNINSCVDMPRIFDKLKISYPKNPHTGNPSITTPWMEKHNHPLCKAIIEARKALKIDRDFILKIIDMQQYSCPGADNYGRVYPELNLLRARTGRFSCTSPNIQQIPSRDPVYGPLCRSIFVPEEGQEWFSLDFSNQEGRLQVHYANRVNAEGGASLAWEFNQDPNLDMHQRVADMVGISRKEAKAINLGLSYGMGNSKLAKQLGTSTERAKEIREKYNSLAPFLNQLNQKCQQAILMKGFIKTLGGRHSHIDPPTYVDGERRTFEYKALNKLIQGSAADQTIECMIQAYREGLPVLFPVHDEICLSANQEQADRMKEIMETCVKLDVPVVVSIGRGGVSWQDGDH